MPRIRDLAILGAILVVAAAIGIFAGVTLGTRQEGPLTNPSGAGARPTIIVATVAPVPSPSTAPSPSAILAAPTVVAQPRPRAAEYVVQPGDTLRTIAQQQYGDAGQWPRIYDANRDVIGPDPDALRPGTTLQLPV